MSQIFDLCRRGCCPTLIVHEPGQLYAITLNEKDGNDRQPATLSLTMEEAKKLAELLIKEGFAS